MNEAEKMNKTEKRVIINDLLYIQRNMSHETHWPELIKIQRINDFISRLWTEYEALKDKQKRGKWIV